MVNADRVKRKLPFLLVNGATTDKRFWAARHRVEHGLKRLRKRKPEQYQSLETRLIHDLEAMEKAASER